MNTSLHHWTHSNRRAGSKSAVMAPFATTLFTSLSRAVDKVFAAPTARKLSRSEEAENVRDMAWCFRNEPGFASDLLAAADRHEGLNN